MMHASKSTNRSSVSSGHTEKNASISAIARSMTLGMGYHLYTLWLFNFNDLKTMVFPSTAFAIFNSIAASRAISASNHHIDYAILITRLPVILVWAWITLLAFTTNNQRSYHSIEEDRLNKPWRPLPAGRLTIVQARYLAFISYPLSILASMYLGGGTRQSFLLVVFGYIYNDMKGGDANFLVRNLLNAFGFTSFASGALEVAIQSPIPASLFPWLLIVAAVVFTTVHTQDMYDQLGDSAAGRRTIPLVIGDSPARWSIALGVAGWSWMGPIYWDSTTMGFLAPVMLGILISFRTLTRKTVEQDKTTFRLYNAWLVCLYALPMLKSFSTV
jgi:4-hydroxybenzoate polyprenyltransferase